MVSRDCTPKTWNHNIVIHTTKLETPFYPDVDVIQYMTIISIQLTHAFGGVRAYTVPFLVLVSVISVLGRLLYLIDTVSPSVCTVCVIITPSRLGINRVWLPILLVAS